MAGPEGVARRILLRLDEHGPASFGSLGVAAAADPDLARRRLDELVEKGWVSENQVRGYPTSYRITVAGHDALHAGAVA